MPTINDERELGQLYDRAQGLSADTIDAPLLRRLMLANRTVSPGIIGEGTPIDAGTVYRTISHWIGDKETSLLLKEAGIDGIRYPTETLHGKPTKGRSEFNYVVFDENDVRLVSRESGGKVEDLTKMVETK